MAGLVLWHGWVGAGAWHGWILNGAIHNIGWCKLSFQKYIPVVRLYPSHPKASLNVQGGCTQRIGNCFPGIVPHPGITRGVDVPL